MSEADISSLIYVSTKPVGADDDDHIVAVSTSRNLFLNVTGALASTKSNYVQILEGSAAALADLMSSIRIDGRHSEVNILREWKSYRRVFPAWSMAYSGSSNYMANHVQDLISCEGDRLTFRVNNCVKLLSGLA